VRGGVERQAGYAALSLADWQLNCEIGRQPRVKAGAKKKLAEKVPVLFRQLFKMLVRVVAHVDWID